MTVIDVECSTSLDKTEKETRKYCYILRHKKRRKEGMWLDLECSISNVRQTNVELSYTICSPCTFVHSLSAFSAVLLLVN